MRAGDGVDGKSSFSPPLPHRRCLSQPVAPRTRSLDSDLAPGAAGRRLPRIPSNQSIRQLCVRYGPCTVSGAWPLSGSLFGRSPTPTWTGRTSRTRMCAGREEHQRRAERRSGEGTPVLGPSGFLRGEIGFGMLRRGAEGNPPKARESGETGRRAGLRIQWAQGPWGFNSPLSHQPCRPRSRTKNGVSR